MHGACKEKSVCIGWRYVMLHNGSGFYCYVIFEHLKEWPALNIPQIEIVSKTPEAHLASVMASSTLASSLSEEELTFTVKWSGKECTVRVHSDDVVGE